MQSPSLRDLYLLSEELKNIAELLARERSIKDYENVPKDKLLNTIISSKPVNKSQKPKFSKARIEKTER